jgi:cytochrome c peroxidase
MRIQRFFSGALRTIACAFAGGILLFPGPSSGQLIGPLPPITKPPNLVPLTPVEQLGKDLGFDITLSDPPGYACFTCHTPETGFASPGPPEGSEVNAILGIPSGVVPGRFRERKPATYAMSAFSPIGPFFDANLGVYIGGVFWDGHAPDEAHQALQPFIDANEMANLSSNGIQDPVAGGFSALVVKKVQSRPYAPLFKRVYGRDVFKKYTPQQIYTIIGEAIAAYEASAEVNPFNSKWDASKYGTPPQNLYTLSDSEERGRILFGIGPNPSNNPNFGKAQCFQCHTSVNLTFLQAEIEGKETFTMFCYANIGVPRNPNNPFYENTDAVSNPLGFNPLGTNFIDWGLGRNPNPAPDGTRFFNTTPGDIQQFRGLMKAPSLRNSDKRPSSDFVRAYMHNGVFKSLEEVVHFYNKRNIAVDGNGNEVAFDLRNGPPAGTTPLLPPPEVLDNVQNVAGLTPAQAAAQGVSGVVATNGQVGNLQLTPSQETDVVNFLKILSDGFGPITPVSFP